VPLRTDAYYRSLAEKALKDAEVTEPPVPVETLAAKLCIPIRALDLPMFFSSAIVAEDGLPVIVLNASKDEYTRRKALAHEMGHMLVVLNDPEGAYPRYIGEHPDAEAIADELLTPAYLVYDQAQKWFNDYRYLARLFGVGEQEMLEKMVQMGLIHQRGITWDY
jgi:Zn-dependent peptidase ImmA (M78 family)